MLAESCFGNVSMASLLHIYTSSVSPCGKCPRESTHGFGLHRLAFVHEAEVKHVFFQTVLATTPSGAALLFFCDSGTAYECSDLLT